MGVGGGGNRWVVLELDVVYSTRMWRVTTPHDTETETPTKPHTHARHLSLTVIRLGTAELLHGATVGRVQHGESQGGDEQGGPGRRLVVWTSNRHELRRRKAQLYGQLAACRGKKTGCGQERHFGRETTREQTRRRNRLEPERPDLTAISVCEQQSLL